MDALKNTLSEITEMFHTRMLEFEGELQKVPPTPTTTASLAAEFTVFRRFITQALGSLQQQVELLARGLDQLEMRSRRKILLVHGVAEEKKEETIQVLAAVIREKLQMSDFSEADINRCHRMGRAAANKTRPILMKVRSLTVRDQIWFSKAKLKGTGVTLSEFLTKGRHDVFLAAREKFGVNKSWTKAGCVYVLGTDETRHRVETLADLSKITLHPSAPESIEPEPTVLETIPAAVTKVATKTKRAATLKK